MDVLRTADDRFASLEGYDLEPHYTEVVASDGTALRLHHVEQGPADGPVALLLHGNPTWSYLHRKMVPALAAAGMRAVSLDLVGCGRSDKPVARADYSLASHVSWVTDWLGQVDLNEVTLFCQDWGGLIGLQVLPHAPERFAAVVASNTGLPLGAGLNSTMKAWLEFSQSAEELPVSGLVQSGTTRPLTDGERAAYDAPFPDGTYQAGIKEFPLLIPLTPENPGTAQTVASWEFLGTFTKPFLTVFGSADPIAFKPGAHLRLQEHVPGAKGLSHQVIDGAGHFIQEDAPDELVAAILSVSGG